MVALLVLGFPVAAVLAWTWQVTPGGVVRDTGAYTEAERGRSPSKAISSASDPSIAVLAFADMSAERDQEYLGNGIAEEIIDALTKLRTISVAARTSAFAFKGRGEDVREIGRKLGVSSVLEGSVRKSGSRLRISAQLISVEDGYHLWSERYDRELDDVFEIQEEIARAVVDGLKVELLRQDEPLVRPTTDNAEAYDHYLKGRHAWQRRYQLGLDAAMEHFRRAIGLDLNFAEPYAGIADTYAILGMYQFDDPDVMRTRATEAARRALDCGPNVPDVRFSAGLYELVFGWDAPRALEHFRAAVRLAGRHPRARGWIGLTLAIQDRFLEGYVESKGALQRSPESPYLLALHGQVCMRERAEEARICFGRALELEPTDIIARYGLGFIESYEGRYDRAIELMTYVYERGGRTPLFASFLAGVLAKAGRRAEADDVLVTGQEGRHAKWSESHKIFASFWLSAWSGDVDHALDTLPALVEARAPGLLTSLNWPVFNQMRTDPRWKILEPFVSG